LEFTGEIYKAILLLALVIAPSPAVAQDVPRVRLVATGGTISNRTGGRLTAEELVQSMPGIERFAKPEFEQFSNVASSELTLAQWVALSKRLNEIFRTEPDIAGLVVTSGTDTLEELAYFLDLTGPQRQAGGGRRLDANPSTLGYEGAANLLEGFRVAASPDARGKGTLVVLNDEINAAREVTKTDALRLNTFQTRGYGSLGVVDADRVAFYRASVKRHAARSEFDIASVTALPRVDVILVYQGADGDLIKAAADAGAKGIRDRGRRRRRDQRDAAGCDRLRHEEGRVRGDDDARGRRTHCRGARRAVAGRRLRSPAGRDPPADCRRGSRAGQGACPPDARADAHVRSRRDPADVHGILINPRKKKPRSTPRSPRNAFVRESPKNRFFSTCSEHAPTRP
jgi:L-asparaginase